MPVQNISTLDKSKPVVLVFSGALNPVHPMHIQALWDKALELQNEGFTIAEILISPSNQHYLDTKKYGPITVDGQSYQRPVLSFEERGRLVLNVASSLARQYPNHYGTLMSKTSVIDTEQRSGADHFTIVPQIQQHYQNHQVLFVAGTDLIDNCCSKYASHDFPIIKLERPNVANSISSTNILNGDPKTIATIHKHYSWYMQLIAPYFSTDNMQPSDDFQNPNANKSFALLSNDEDDTHIRAYDQYENRRKWMGYAAAAVLGGAILIAGGVGVAALIYFGIPALAGAALVSGVSLLVSFAAGVGLPTAVASTIATIGACLAIAIPAMITAATALTVAYFIVKEPEQKKMQPLLVDEDSDDDYDDKEDDEHQYGNTHQPGMLSRLFSWLMCDSNEGDDSDSEDEDLVAAAHRFKQQ